MSKAAKVKLLTTIILAGFLVAVGFNIWASQLGLPYPYNTFLFEPRARWSDFTDVYNSSKFLRPYERHLALYMPLTYLLMYPVTWVPLATAVMAYLTGLLLFVFGYVYESVRSLKMGLYPTFGVCVVLGFLTYGNLMLLDRANLDGVTFVLTGTAFLAYKREKHGWTVVLLAIAGAMKLYPLVMVFLYANRRQWRHALGAALLSLALMGVSLFAFRTPATASLAAYSKHMGEFTKDYVLRNNGMGHTCSIFATLKAVALLLPHSEARLALITPQLAHKFSLFSVAFLLYLFVHLTFVERENWRKLAVGLLTVVFLPVVSCDYRLIFLVIVMMLYVDRPARSRREDLCTGILLGSILVPKQYAFLPGITTDSGAADVSWNVFYNAPVMLVLTLFWIWQGWRERKLPGGGTAPLSSQLHTAQPSQVPA